MMLSVLAVHGYSAIEQDNATKIVPEITGRQAFNSFPRPNSPSDKLVTDIIRPKFAAVNSLISILRPIMSTQGHIAVYAPTNSLIIADRAGNVKKLTAIINELDKTPGETYEIIKLSYSSSKEVSKIIDKILWEVLYVRSTGNSTASKSEDFNSHPNLFGFKKISYNPY